MKKTQIMKKTLITLFALLTLQINAQNDSLVTPIETWQPPIAVEVMAGNKSSMFEMMVSKQIMNSKFKFNNMTIFEIDYDKETSDYYYLQTIIFYDLPKGFGVGLGANLQSYNVFKPLVAVSYSHFTDNISFFIQPSYELHKDGAFEVYSFFEWIDSNKKNLQAYAKVSAYTSLNEEHIYSYNNWRLGANYKSFRFGPAMNIQFYGKEFNSNFNFGAFVNILID